MLNIKDRVSRSNPLNFLTDPPEFPEDRVIVPCTKAQRKREKGLSWPDLVETYRRAGTIEGTAFCLGISEEYAHSCLKACASSRDISLPKMRYVDGTASPDEMYAEYAKHGSLEIAARFFRISPSVMRGIMSCAGYTIETNRGKGSSVSSDQALYYYRKLGREGAMERLQISEARLIKYLAIHGIELDPPSHPDALLKSIIVARRRRSARASQ